MKDLERAEIQEALLCDMNYLSGLKAGWNFAQSGNDELYLRIVEDMQKLIREARQELKK
jgi:hypothetical protein